MNASALSPARLQFVRRLQSINFGRVENLPFKAGEPQLDASTKVIREIKFGGENGPRAEVEKTDFALKAQVCELFAQMEAMGDGTIRSLEVKHGLPFKMTLEEDAA